MGGPPRRISDFTYILFIVRDRDECPFGSEHSPIIVLAGLVVPLKTTLVSPCTGLVVPSQPPSFRRVLGIIAGFAAPAATA